MWLSTVLPWLPVCSAAQLRVFMGLLPDYHRHLRERILAIAFLPGSENTPAPMNLPPATLTTLTVLFALALRPVQLAAAVIESPEMKDGSYSALFSSFCAQILSVPLLAARLKSAGLDKLLSVLTARPVWYGAMTAIGNAAFLPRLPVCALSYSWKDDRSSGGASGATDNIGMERKEEKGAAAAAATSSSSSSSVSASSVAPMQLSDDEEEDEDDSDADTDAAAAAAARQQQQAKALEWYRREGWLLGNVIELGQLAVAGGASAAAAVSPREFGAFLRALTQLLLTTPPQRYFPPPQQHQHGSASTAAAAPVTIFRHVHPLLADQLSLFTDRGFMDSLSKSVVKLGSSAAAADAKADLPALAYVLNLVLSRWSAAASTDLLNAIVFSTPLLPLLWDALCSSGVVAAVTASEGAAGEGKAETAASLVHSSSSSFAPLSPTSSPSKEERKELGSEGGGGGAVGLSADAVGLVSLFARCYAHLLLIQDDEEFHSGNKPFSLAQVTELVIFLRCLLLRLYWTNWEEAKHSQTAQRLKTVVVQLFQQLRERQSRKPFCQPDTWLMKLVSTAAFEAELKEAQRGWSERQQQQQQQHRGHKRLGAVLKKTSSQAASAAERARALVADVPFVLPFKDRVRIFYQLIANDRAAEEKRAAMSAWHGMDEEEDEAGFFRSPAAGYGPINIRIRRDRVLQDGFQQLHKYSGRLKQRIRVTFIDEHGNEESGIDGGGLFKEFLLSVSKTAFNPSYGLFCETSEHFLYPNPDVQAVPGLEDYLEYYRFIGQVVGKALYENVLVAPQFALFFLRILLGRRNSVNDLASLDPELYKNLLWLKKHEGDFGELGLTFSVEQQVLDHRKTVELIPGGANVPVTKANCIRYIYALADYKLNKQLRAQSAAFLRGIHDLINAEWLRMFTPEELSELISGKPEVDLEDLRRNVVYQGYTENHEAIKWFWEILHEFDTSQRQAFLRFCTSVSRAPLQGFGSLQPRLCIQLVPVPDAAAAEQLPTASTCLNLLRLPRYPSKQKMKQKLLYAITSNAGFALT